MDRAMARHVANEARVVPVLLRPVDWTGAPFSSLQMLPSNAIPVSSWSNRDEALQDVARGIRQIVTELLGVDTTTQQTHQKHKTICSQQSPQGNFDVRIGERSVTIGGDV